MTTHQFPTYQIKGKQVEYKTISFLVKSVDQDQGIVTGLASPTTNIDLQKDTVESGAYTKTLMEAQQRMQHGRRFMYATLWMHDPMQPTGGVISGHETPDGLEVTMKYDISTNAAGHPNNPIATMVFSGFKVGYIDELSIGYIPVKYDYDKQGVRHLREIQLIEISGVTMLFAANPEALVSASGVKSMVCQTKSVCGDTSLPIGPRDASWDGSEAHNQIVTWATKDDGTIDTAKMKKVHLQCDGDADKITSYGYAFCNIEDDNPVINVGGVKACAGALSGARGADAGSDTHAMQAKVETMYNRINKKYPDDPQLSPPWKEDGKMNTKPIKLKTLLEHYNEEMAEDLIEDWRDVYVRALTGAIFDAFTIGDQPEQDISEVLDTFKELVLSKFVAQAIECDLSQYLADNNLSFNPSEYTMHNGSGGCYGYMTHSKRPDGKVGARISSATQQTLEEHQKCLHGFKSALTKMATEIGQKASDLTQLWQEEDQGEPYGNDDNDGKSLTRREPPSSALSRQELQPLHKSTVDDDPINDFFSL
jgi:HK97 family phage prohead protease